MSYYSNNPAHCRVDVWKKSGKWYETITVEFKGQLWPGNGWEADLIHDAF